MEFASFVLAAATADLTEEPAARAHAHAVEFRMDRATDPLDALAAYDGDLPLLATNRVASEGGEAPTGERRLAVLERAAEHSTVAAIDIELATVEKKETRVAEHAREHGTKVVVSVHDFAGTPSRAEMTDLLARAGEYGDIAKLAVTAESSEDVLDLLAVTREHEAAGHRAATMAMGEVGKHSRAIAPLYGSKIGYAPVDPEKATAPGQYDLATLAGLVDALG